MKRENLSIESKDKPTDSTTAIPDDLHSFACLNATPSALKRPIEKSNVEDARGGKRSRAEQRSTETHFYYSAERNVGSPDLAILFFDRRIPLPHRGHEHDTPPKFSVHIAFVRRASPVVDLSEPGAWPLQ